MKWQKCIQIFNVGKSIGFTICHELCHISDQFQFFSNCHTLKFLKVKCNPVNKKSLALDENILFVGSRKMGFSTKKKKKLSDAE